MGVSAFCAGGTHFESSKSDQKIDIAVMTTRDPPMFWNPPNRRVPTSRRFVGLAESASSAKWFLKIQGSVEKKCLYGQKKVHFCKCQEIGKIRICGFQGFQVRPGYDSL